MRPPRRQSEAARAAKLQAALEAVALLAARVEAKQMPPEQGMYRAGEVATNALARRTWR